MRAYRVAWLVVFLPLFGVGLGVTFVLSPAALVCLFSSFAVVGALVAVCVDDEHETRSSRGCTRRVVAGAAAGGSGAGAFVGFAVILGASVFLLALVAVMSSPYAVEAYERWLGSSSTPAAARLDTVVRALAYACPEYWPIQPPATLDELTDDELCDCWRATCAVLRRGRPAGKLLATVAERQRYLDELERRHPAGVAAWLASGDLTSSGPLSYVSARWEPRATINWDDLTRGQGW